MRVAFFLLIFFACTVFAEPTKINFRVVKKTLPGTWEPLSPTMALQAVPEHFWLLGYQSRGACEIYNEPGVPRWWLLPDNCGITRNRRDFQIQFASLEDRDLANQLAENLPV